MTLVPHQSLEDRIEAIERFLTSQHPAWNTRPIVVPIGTSGSATLTEPPLSPAGWVRPKNTYANIRYAPTIDSVDVGDLTVARPVIRRTSQSDENGFYWYQLGENEFVRQDVVIYYADAPVPLPSSKWAAPTTGYKIMSHHGEGGHKGVDLATGGLRPPVSIGPNGGTVVKTFLCTICKPEGDGAWTLNVPAYGGGFGTYAIVRYNRSSLPEAAQPHVKEHVFVIYAHLSALSVIQGNIYPAGHILGYIGSTGNSTGNHLHLEVRTSDNPNENFYSAALVDPNLIFAL
jgi:murein DD-endopeptidase MepM/ murein hydrolase activator NlpD